MERDTGSGDSFTPCHAGSDGDCYWSECPQEADNRANYQHAGCPLWLADPCTCDPEWQPDCPRHASDIGRGLTDD